MGRKESNQTNKIPHHNEPTIKVALGGASISSSDNWEPPLQFRPLLRPLQRRCLQGQDEVRSLNSFDELLAPSQALSESNSCLLTRPKYSPLRLSSCWWVPCSIISPLSMTMIRSAFSTVLSLWAIMITVCPLKFWYKACWTVNSDSESSALVASSKRRTLGFLNRALAMATLCFWPPINNGKQNFMSSDCKNV